MNRGDNSPRRGEPLQLEDPVESQAALPEADGRPASDDGAEQAVVDRPSADIREPAAEARPEGAS